MSQKEKMLREQIETIKRSIHLCETSDFKGGVAVKDDNGNVIRFVPFDKDTTALREALTETENRLASLSA